MKLAWLYPTLKSKTAAVIGEGRGEGPVHGDWMGYSSRNYVLRSLQLSKTDI